MTQDIMKHISPVDCDGCGETEAYITSIQYDDRPVPERVIDLCDRCIKRMRKASKRRLPYERL